MTHKRGLAIDDGHKSDFLSFFLSFFNGSFLLYPWIGELEWDKNYNVKRGEIMKKSIIIFTLLALSCTAFAADITIQSNELTPYTKNETLVYNIVAYVDFEAGDPPTCNSTVTDYHYPGQEDGTVKSIDDSDCFASASVSYYFHDESNSVFEYASDDYFYNYDDNEAGILNIRSPIIIGDSWTNKTVLVERDGTFFEGRTSYVVVEKETVSVPLGEIETYKFSVSGEFTEADETVLPEKIKIYGDTWLHPVIGTIKSQSMLEHSSNSGLLLHNQAILRELVSSTILPEEKEEETQEDTQDTASNTPAPAPAGGGGGCFINTSF